MDIYVLAGLITTMGLVNGIGLINNHKKVPSIDDKTGKNGTIYNIGNNKADFPSQNVNESSVVIVVLIVLAHILLKE